MTFPVFIPVPANAQQFALSAKGRNIIQKAPLLFVGQQPVKGVIEKSN